MTPSKKVLLIYPGQVLVSTYGDTLQIKSSLLNLLSYLRTKGVADVEILDLALEHGKPVRTEEDLASFHRMCEEKLGEYDFDIVGISCFSTFNYLSSVLVASLCKRSAPGALIVVGGWHCLVRPRDFDLSPGVFDFVVQGEGEKTLLQIIEGRVPSRGEGVTVVRGEPLNGNDYAGFEYDFEAYKTHCRSLLNAPKVESVEFNLSRQCPFTCSFCDNRALGYQGWNVFSVEKSIGLVDKAVAAFEGLKSITFNEAVFGLDKRWRRGFLSALSKLRHNVVFLTQTRIDLLEEEDIDLLGELETLFCYFGVDSLSEKALAAMNKSNKPTVYIHKARENLSMLKELWIPFVINLILDHPGESHETLRETYANLKGILDEKVYIQTFQYYYWLPVFVDSYELYHARCGAMAEGNLEWWRDPDPAGAMARSRYVPSSAPGEPFEAAFDRYHRFLIFWKHFYDYYKMKKHFSSIIEERRCQRRGDRR